MNRILLLAVLLMCSTAALSFHHERPAVTTAIVAANNATHIARISGDTLVVITGSTYLFTVDTPEDQGLVSTGITATQLPGQLRSPDGSSQQYKVNSKEGIAKNNEPIKSGDRLIVTAEDGKTTKAYHILVQPMAMSGRLQLEVGWR